MPYRQTVLATGEFYHIFNRGVARMPTFVTSRDYSRFTQALQYYMNANAKPKFSAAHELSILHSATKNLIDIIAYCLMPNHFHLLLKQKTENGISQYMKNISISYTKYFNIKNDRVGPLFQGAFKAVRIETTEQLLHVHRYIHINPTVGFVTKSLEDYPWSSFHEYAKRKIGFCEKELILSNFSNPKQYRQFLLDQEDYGKQLKGIQHLLLDLEK